MQQWLRSLPAGSTVSVAPGACYLVNEGVTLDGAQGLTISGGMWKDTSQPQSGAPASQMNPIFWLVGGSGLTLESLSISGVNPGGYDSSGAFAAGIRSDGVIGLNVNNVVVDDVYGDGIELGPLRAAGDISNVIVNPSENVTITSVSIDGSGRQGMTLASVTDATISSVSLKHIGLDVFDLEADQWDEGALDVIINGCTVGGGNGGLFFANAGVSAGSAHTGNITIENCTMLTPDGGDAVLVETPNLEAHPRGPITFLHDSLQCGSSVYVACVMATDAQISVDGSTVTVPPGTVHEPVYGATESSVLTFESDVVNGYGRQGTSDGTSSVAISGGSWTPYGAARPLPSPGSGSSPGSGTSPGGSITPSPASTTTSTTAPARHSPTSNGPGVGSHQEAASALASDVSPPAAVGSLGRPILQGHLLAVGVSAVALGLGLLVARRRRLRRELAPFAQRTVEELLAPRR